MDKFLKQFLPASILQQQTTQSVDKENKQQQSLAKQQQTDLTLTPPSTPIVEMSVAKITPEQPEQQQSTKETTPILKRKLIQVSKSLFNRSLDQQLPPPTPPANNIESPTINHTKSLPIGTTTTVDVNKLVFQTKYDELRFYLEEIRTHFQNLIENKTDTPNNLASLMYKLTSNYLLHLEKCISLNESLMKNAEKYDYNEEFKYNGYRTLSATLEKCCIHTLVVVKNIFKQKQNFLFQMKYQFLSSSIKEYETWCLLIEKLHMLLTIAQEMQEKTTQTNSLILFQNLISTSIEKNLFLLASTHQEAFFGRTCAFQFCDSLKLPLTACTVALASYNESYDVTQNALVRKTAKSLFSSTKYMLNPELRAQKLSNIMKNADVDFCKAFWQLTETPIVQMGSDLITPNLPIAVVKTLDQTVLTIEKPNSTETIQIQPPICRNNEVTPLNIRILSAEFRQGMENLDKSLLESYMSTSNKRSIAQKSPHLILHCHGGGFIAHSSKSHEIYLKPWCKDLHVPIVSIDYSLAPEHPFPKASEECFYVYVWCLLNKDQLGWTGEKIICVGDSAGGVLVTNIVQRAIQAGVRIPDALVPIYAPFLLSYSLSPSRLMSVMDPLLNLGILWRCLAAYCGIDFKSFETPSPNTLRKLIDTNKANLNLKNDENSQIKQNSLVNENGGEIQTNENDVVMEDDAEFKAKEENLKLLEKLIGNSVYLIELLRHHHLPLNPIMSPLLSDDNLLKQMPKTYLITATHDPLLDDNIEFKKRLDKLNNLNCKLHILNGLHHGFLNFSHINKDCKKASKFVTQIIKLAFTL